MDIIGDLIEFIMGNLFFVVLILGAIFNFLRRKPDTEQAPNKESRRTGPESNQGEGRTQLKDIFQQIEEAFKEEQEAQQPKPTPKEQPAPIVEHRVESQEMMDRYERLKETSRHEAVSDRLKPKASTQVQRKSTQTSRLSLSKKQALQGVVWAEILGPPRAKRSLSSSRQLNRR
ncbi:hypothetical protein [Bacillus sp. PS06]|uniref:hypothetical protein n=1 Tax=Bacillus sp. PS06 TaxID=2764176 RepID=UPI00177B084C|nr:hypothetical protein [Bacillus sp. PS06]MBD8069195.1 hypothetical protein [Bacillus sp. PS06]